MKTANENTEPKIVFLFENESENDLASTDRFRKLPYLCGNLPSVLLYLKPSPTHAFPAQ